MKRHWPAIAIGVPAALLLFVIFLILLIPDRELQGLVGRAVAREGYTLRADRLGKALPLGIEARNLELADERGMLVKADELSVRLRLLPLLAGRVSFDFRARIGKGDVKGDFS